jgi:hypothetical protein
MEIRNYFPELAKYLEETPMNYQEDTGVNRKNLEEYSETFHQMVKNYSNQHNQKNKL